MAAQTDDSEKSVNYQKAIDLLAKLNNPSVSGRVVAFHDELQTSIQPAETGTISEAGSSTDVTTTHNNSLDWMRNIVGFGSGLEHVSNLAEVGQAHLFVEAYKKMRVTTSY